MSGRHAVRATLLAVALALTAANAGTANAAQVTLQPSPVEARTFAATAGGWSSTIDYGGVCLIPGVTCPLATPSHEPAGGAGGTGDGFLRDGFTTVLGLLSTTTISWSSPSFVAPANPDTASLSVAVRPQIASLLTIGSVRLRMSVIDVADGTRDTVVADVPLTAASASFAPVSANVPAGALVPGRSYRVRLDVALTTTVSAVNSGSVDLDDVVLRITDLEPPSGLTGSFQTTGALRVDGTVDPLGQTTSVIAQYGTTAAYGSSTSPVVVDGTGAQPFSIPLASLTPGATYHYRLVAQNADGTTTTTDQTFVAPVPPSDAPPLVTGAGNSRDRAVVFDHDATVVAATVEVLDSSRTVVGTFPDADGDGSVTITLPDVDGSYGVRVVRENASSQTTTSAEVPAVLDRIAPNTAGVALSVLPELSSDPQRTVAFTPPGDAIAAAVQVLDGLGDPVGPAVAAVGGMATVQLSGGDGDYTVRLTLNDVAGNVARVDSSVITLDTTATSGGGAPLVTGAGNSRERDIVFERDPTTTVATIEVLDGDGRVVASANVASGDSGTVTLPDEDGDYTVRVRQQDLAGNSDTSAGTPVTLDRVAPAAGPAPTVAGAVNSRDRDVSFTRDPSTAGATIEVLDGSGVVASVAVPTGNSATVTLPDADGAYSVRVRQTDAATNVATSPETETTLDRIAPDPGPAPTVDGPGNSRDRTVEFVRPSDAESAVIELLDGDAHVIDTVPVPTGAGGAITLPAADGAYGVRVEVTDAAGNSATTPVTPIVLDTAPPDAGPAPTVSGPPDALAVSFRRAPDAATAVVEVLDAGGNVIATVPVAPGADAATVDLPDTPGLYAIRVVQTDAAGNSATTPPATVVRDAPDDRRDDGRDDRRDDGTGGEGTGGNGGDGTGGTGTGGTGTGTGGTGRDGSGAPALTDPGRYGVLLRQCFGGDVVLTDVTARGARVSVKGLSRYAPGSAVTILDRAGRRVGRARVASTGGFATVVKAPASARARLASGYRAVVGGRRSPIVRLRRANVLTAVAVRGATIAIRGRVDVARLGSLRRVRVFGGAGATACGSARPLRIVGRVAVNRRTGRYSLRVRAPRGSGRLVVRTQTFGTKLVSRSSFAVK